jgi:hypothetical protein
MENIVLTKKKIQITKNRKKKTFVKFTLSPLKDLLILNFFKINYKARFHIVSKQCET